MALVTKQNYKTLISTMVLSGLLSISCPGHTEATSQDRKNISEQYKWDLSDLYQSEKDWQQDKDNLIATLPRIEEYRGTLAKSAKHLKNALDGYYESDKTLNKLYTYANLLSDQDTREARPLAIKQEVQHLSTQLSKAASYLKPEILRIPNKKLQVFYKKEPDLETYRHIIDDIQRNKAHTLNEAEEKLVAEASRISSTALDTYDTLSNSDLPYTSITLSDGSHVYLNSSGYASTRASKNRQDRIKVFNTFFGSLKKFEQTFGGLLYGEIKKNIFYKNVKKFDSSLESALNESNIPTSVYHNLIKNTNQNLSTFHRYLSLRKKLLKLKELHYYDLYVPVVKGISLSYTYEESINLTKDALRVLGKDYIAVIDKALEERWVDALPNTGKKSGAYVSGSAYDAHPYMLLNFNGQYNSMSTFAHEFGHVLHSYLSNKNQPFHNADYPIFLAEVASTANETLLINHLLTKINNDNEKLALLTAHLDAFKGSLFRQAQFAEFELKIHELAESGEALTGEKFSEVYLSILKKYYGHDKGIMTIDDTFAIEWAYIPHFYYNFYVFQYSTSYTAAQALAEKMQNGDEKMIKRYLEFLSSGGSDYAIPTLKKVGIDMTSDTPFKLAIEKMNKTMDEIDKILIKIKR